MGPSQRGGRWGLLLPLLLLLRRRRRLRARQPAPACSFGLAIYGRTTIPASVTTKSHSSLHSHADGHNNGSQMWMLGMRQGIRKSVVWQVGGKIKERSRCRINILQWGYILSCLSHRWSLKIHTFIHVGERFKKERKTFTFDSTHDDERDNDERLVRVEVVYLPSATGEEAPP